jgi:hypothetical protein
LQGVAKDIQVAASIVFGLPPVLVIELDAPSARRPVDQTHF